MYNPARVHSESRACQQDTATPQKCNASSSFHLSNARRSVHRLAAFIHQKVQTPRPTSAPQERHATCRLANAHARELTHPRIPFLSRQDERRAEPCPRPRWPWPCYLRGGGGGTTMSRGRTATRALLFVWLLRFLPHRRIRCFALGITTANGLGRQGR